jgi:hypothetical protein
VVGVDRRLDLLTSELTPRERGMLWLREWRDDVPHDDRLIRLCPPQDKPEMDRFVLAVEQGNREAHGLLVILLEWAANIETDLHFYRALRLHRERIRSLEAVAKKAVPPLPPPWNMDRKVPIGWGRLVGEDGSDEAGSWDEVEEKLRRDLIRSISFRWNDLLVLDEVFEELERALGEEMMYFEVRQFLDGYRQALVRMRSALESDGEAFELAGPHEGQANLIREAFDWSVIRPAPEDKHPREWMHPQQAEELQSWERVQADTLRSGEHGST